MATTTTRPVGLDLQDNEQNRRVVEAVQRDNPDLIVRHLPGLVKLQAPGRLVINRATVEELLGQPWETHEFQMAIVTYFGVITDWDDDHIVIRWEH